MWFLYRPKKAHARPRRSASDIKIMLIHQKSYSRTSNIHRIDEISQIIGKIYTKNTFKYLVSAVIAMKTFFFYFSYLKQENIQVFDQELVSSDCFLGLARVKAQVNFWTKQEPSCPLKNLKMYLFSLYCESRRTFYGPKRRRELRPIANNLKK